MSRLTLATATVQVMIDPEHGAEIVTLAGADGVNVLAQYAWRSPLPVARGSSYGSDEADWLSAYRGGWQELFPNAGPACVVDGVALPFHGEVSRARWEWRWIDAPQELELSCAARLPLLLTRRMRLDPKRPVLYLEEHISNEARVTAPYIWGHHAAFGPPLVADGALLDLPTSDLAVDSSYDGAHNDLVPGASGTWPQVPGKRGEHVDLRAVPPAPCQRFYGLSGLPAGWCALRNPASGYGLALAWDVAAFPCVWVWQDNGGDQGFPWYGRAQLTAIEPATQWPATGLGDALRMGQARQLEPGAEARSWLTCALFRATERPVRAVDRQGNITY
jgi:hypothetical protein